MKGQNATNTAVVGMASVCKKLKAFFISISLISILVGCSSQKFEALNHKSEHDRIETNEYLEAQKVIIQQNPAIKSKISEIQRGVRMVTSAELPKEFYKGNGQIYLCKALDP